MWAELVVVDPHKFDEATPGNKLYGVYASGAETETVNADLYWLGADNASAAFNGTSGASGGRRSAGVQWRGRVRLSALSHETRAGRLNTRAPAWQAPTSTWRRRPSSA